MNQEERSQRSRKQVLDAALKLFSHQGYRATSIRDIAEAAVRLRSQRAVHHGVCRIQGSICQRA